MDAQRFDRIAKSLAARASRRRLVGGLAALGAVGGGVLAPERAGAQGGPGLPDGSGVTTEATDPSCTGKPAISNRACVRSQCGGSAACGCIENVKGAKKCANLSMVRCPEQDECGRTRGCGGGEVCVKIGGCCAGSRRNVCVPLCG
jgi:hypothetical protein